MDAIQLVREGQMKLLAGITAFWLIAFCVSELMLMMRSLPMSWGIVLYTAGIIIGNCWLKVITFGKD